MEERSGRQNFKLFGAGILEQSIRARNRVGIEYIGYIGCRNRFFGKDS
jgi:hypothetical protein